jgi:hypothetical protein
MRLYKSALGLGHNVGHKFLATDRPSEPQLSEVCVEARSVRMERLGGACSSPA